MNKIPPPPFTKAMTIKLPKPIPKAPKWEPKSQSEIMDLLKGHITKQMTKKVPPPPFTKSMTIKAPVKVPYIPKAPVFNP